MGGNREMRWNFKGSLNDFLDAAQNPEGNPIGGGPAASLPDLITNVRVGVSQFGRPRAAAVILNPTTKLDLELTAASQGETEDGADYSERSTIDGLPTYESGHVGEMCYTVVGREDLIRLVESGDAV